MRTLIRFLSSGPSLLGLTLVAVFLGVALAAPVLAPAEDAIDAPPGFRRVGRAVDMTPHPPSEDAPVGTLPGQFDVFYTLVWGTRSALGFGLTVALATAALGTVIGVLIGYAGGWAYRLGMMVVDAFLTFPALAGYVLIEHVVISLQPRPDFIIMQTVVEALGASPLLLTLIVFSWMPYARIISSSALRLKQVEYVEASRALGAGARRVVFQHILPNILAPSIVLAARDVGGMVILSAAFTFIQVGSSSPWGELIVRGRDWIIGPGGNPLTYWWTYLPATLALLFFGIGWNLLGDGLANLLILHQKDAQAAAVARKGIGRALSIPASAAALGLILGVLWSWWAQPLRPSGLTIDALREENRAEFLRMSIEIFSRDLDLDGAMARYQSLGRHAEETLDLMKRLTASPSQRTVRQFTMVADQLAPFYPIDTTPTPPSLRSLLLLLIPIGAPILFLLSAPTAVQELALWARRRRRLARPPTRR
jgi:peptide/nickel transport system permease protein